MNPLATVKSIATTMTFQDAGRHGWRRFGIAPCGFIDPHSARLANRLVNNLPDDTVIEIGPGGGTIVIHHDTWIALTGAGSVALQNPINNFAVFVRGGSSITITPTANGLWTYLAIPSGWNAESAFGSTSHHARSGIGTAIHSDSQLVANEAAKGDLFLGVNYRRPTIDDVRNFCEPPLIRLTPGPHLDRCDDNILRQFIASPWQTSANGFDRTGYQLNGQQLADTKTIHSTPVVVGSIQLPPSGQPIVTMNDGPTVGGYPVIAVVHADDLSWLAQTPPGRDIYFTLDE